MKKIILLAILGSLQFYNSQATIFTVNSTSDANSNTNATTGTLRWCITQANLTPAADIINFSIAGTFTVGSNYPVISQPLTINGFSAPEAVQAQLGTGARVMQIILNGPGNGTVYGFQITANNCEISGIVIQNFRQGIYINGGDNNWIWGCYIGTASNGLSLSASTTCWDDGIALGSNANNNIIGTNGDGSNDANEGNLIAGNGDNGTQYAGECISINKGGAIGANCTGNRIAGNYLGPNETGTTALYTNGTANAQRGSGVQLEYSTLNIIGTNGDGISDALERNIISGNSDCGIVMLGGGSNKIKGNYIGTTKTGNAAIPNYADGGVDIACVGIRIYTGSNNNIIGTDGDGLNDNIEGNIIGSSTITGGGNGNSFSYGIYITASTGTTIAGNNLGIGSDGTTALNFATTNWNYTDKCIYVSGGSTNTILGTNGDGISDTYEKNYLGNSSNGIVIDNSNSCIVAGNYFGIGKDLTTAEPITNTTVVSTGVYILNSTSCRIGSTASNVLERNYFCNITYDGVLIDGNNSANNDLNNIRYNVFGIRPDGVAAANGFHAIEVNQLSNADTIQYNIITQNGTITPDGTYSAVLIGGPNANDESSGCVIFQNQIYKNIGRGIDILGNLSIHNKVSQNSIYNNGNSSNSTASIPAFSKYSVGLDNGYDGPTANDSKDPDAGPNGYSNFPVVSSFASGAGSCLGLISGSFSGLPNTSYFVETFSSDVCNGDTAGNDYYSNATYNYGEGRAYLGTSATFTTNSGGNGSWSVSIPINSLAGGYITAIAIQASGTDMNNTSEFSRCFPVYYDCGDAPDTYHTLLANCGAVHLSMNTNLKIGSTIDADDDGVPTVQADGDGADEDGIATIPSLTVKATTYTISGIPVTNTTGSTATLYAWIDFNGNGAFESTEYAFATVLNNATTASLTWNLASLSCGSTLVAGNTYMRLRLTTSVLTDVAGTITVDERSYGVAANGEVEDYKIYIYGYDYGDLSNLYPVATALCYEDTATAKVWAGIIKPSRECAQKYSIDATGDGNEEDGLKTSIGASGTTNTWVIKLNANQANKTVYYGLWLDWNADKSFTTTSPDAFYSGSAVVNGPTNVSRSVLIPTGFSNSACFRLIVSETALTSSMYNATITNAEIEDYYLMIILNAPGNILMGSSQSQSNILKWKNTSGLNVTNYIVERSMDNISWAQIGSVFGSGNNSAMQYIYTDNHLLNEKNYYRLKLVFADNTWQYSNMLSLVDKNNAAPFVVYPNPAKNTITIQTTNAAYNKLKIFDLTGRLEITQPINSVNTSVDISAIPPGTHLIKFSNTNGREIIQRFVKIK